VCARVCVRVCVRVCGGVGGGNGMPDVSLRSNTGAAHQTEPKQLSSTPFPIRESSHYVGTQCVPQITSLN